MREAYLKPRDERQQLPLCKLENTLRRIYPEETVKEILLRFGYEEKENGDA